jgi:hypothetical protein
MATPPADRRVLAIGRSAALWNGHQLMVTESMNPTPTRRNKIGLVLCGLLGLGDIIGLVAIGSPSDGNNGPPKGILISSAILGVITVAAVIRTWRARSRPAARVVAGSRVLSALTSVPAFFVGDVPAGLIIVAGAGIAVTLISVWLILGRTDPKAAAAAPGHPAAAHGSAG